MKFLKEHKLCRRLIIIFVAIVFLTTMFTGLSKAWDMGDLMEAIIKLIVSLADAAMSILQKILFDTDRTIIVIGKGLWAKIIMSVVALGVIASIGITKIVPLTTLVIVTVTRF